MLRRGLRLGLRRVGIDELCLSGFDFICARMIPIYDPVITKVMNINIIELESQIWH